MSNVAPGALALLFILAMVWLRTRLHYAKAGAGRLKLTRAGAGDFAALLALLLAGWFAAPLLVRSLGLALLSDSFVRAAWCLAAYLAFIPLHRLLLARGLPVFRAGA